MAYFKVHYQSMTARYDLGTHEADDEHQAKCKAMAKSRAFRPEEVVLLTARQVMPSFPRGD